MVVKPQTPPELFCAYVSASLVILLLVIIKLEASENTINSNLDVLRLLQTYGMNILHAGRDYYQLKNVMSWKSVELQNVRIFNLKSLYVGCVPGVKVLPTTSSFKNAWQMHTRCFSITWCVGFEKLLVEGQSRINTFFNTKFHDVNITIDPLLLETRLKICLPFLESSSKSSLSSTCDVTFSAEVEDVELREFGGVHIKGEGTFNKIVGFFVNNGLFTQLIRKEIVKKMKKMLPNKFAEFREKVCYKIDRFVKRTIELYAI
ncbi:unnamed protein product [Rodentolepis nana]|uniref:Uncharacterized protein n=1 Tax=Rodentolepis nana TaxID=102285 RepID=A0A3P7TL41_RODNA|nr:unnamed protein product [Rodentolepis nana]